MDPQKELEGCDELIALLTEKVQQLGGSHEVIESILRECVHSKHL